jgi:hypothetical protein
VAGWVGFRSVNPGGDLQKLPSKSISTAHGASKRTAYTRPGRAGTDWGDPTTGPPPEGSVLAGTCGLNGVALGVRVAVGVRSERGVTVVARAKRMAPSTDASTRAATTTLALETRTARLSH